MKKQPALLSLLLAIALATSAVAQRGGGGGNGGGGGKSNSSNQNGGKEQKTEDASNAELADLTSKLTLTDPQKAAVKSTLGARDAQLAALRKEKLPRDETKDKSKALKEAAYDKIRTLLTPNQQKIFDKSFKKSGKKEKEKEEAPEAAPTPTTAATRAPPAA